LGCCPSAQSLSGVFRQPGRLGSRHAGRRPRPGRWVKSAPRKFRLSAPGILRWNQRITRSNTDCRAGRSGLGWPGPQSGQPWGYEWKPRNTFSGLLPQFDVWEATPSAGQNRGSQPTTRWGGKWNALPRPESEQAQWGRVDGWATTWTQIMGFAEQGAPANHLCG